MVKMAFREKIKLFPNAPGCALSQKNTKKIIPVGHFQGMVEGQAPLCAGGRCSEKGWNQSYLLQCTVRQSIGDDFIT